MAAVLARLGAEARREPLLYALIAATLAGVLGAAALTSPFPLALPIGALGVLAFVRNLRFGLFAALALTCVSKEVELGPLGLDFPGEPVAVLLLALGGVVLLARGRRIEGALVRHPVTLLLVAHVAWIALAALTSAHPLTSWKFLAAKLWYVVPFYGLATLLVRRRRHLRTLLKVLAVPLTAALAICLVRHAGYGFSFEDVNPAVFILFRNHVAYAALASILLPLMLLGAWEFRGGSGWRWGLLLAAAVALVAVQTSYTRAAYVGLLGAAAFVGVIHLRLVRPVLIAGLAVLVLGVSFVLSDNRFFRFAPNYEKTISQESFGDLVEATYKLEDISTMERVYRWVAGGYMVGERPWLGWGPGNFPRFYRGYALETFRTYVSDNEEGSGVHNYLLMVLVEQGWIGLAIFVALCAAGLVTAERAYHRARSPAERRAVAMLAASLAVNLSFQLINDMLESDKSGPWFLFALAGLVVLDLNGRLRGGRWDSPLRVVGEG